ncbi:nicotinate-nucleotide--dimethylbenzimidazole phosphoribosyltransferase [Caulobacter segnis]
MRARNPCNAAIEAALTLDEGRRGPGAWGRGVAQDAIAEGFQVLALGEMGIGNTASAALVMRLAPAPLAECVGARDGP